MKFNKSYYISISVLVIIIIIVMYFVFKGGNSAANSSNFHTLLVWNCGKVTYSGIVNSAPKCDIMMITNLSRNDVYTETTDADNALPNLYSSTFEKDVMFSEKELMSSKCEDRVHNSYHGVSVALYVPQTTVKYYKHTKVNNFHLTVRKYVRILDNVKVTIAFINYNDSTKDPNSKESLYAYADVFAFIKTNYGTDNLLIISEMTIHGYEIIFKTIFDKDANNYVFPDLYKFPIVNNQSALYSNIAVIAKKTVYNKIDFELLMPNVMSSNSFALKAYLYKKGNGNNNVTSGDILKLIDSIKTNTKRKDYTESSGDFDVSYKADDKNMVDWQVSASIKVHQNAEYEKFKKI